MDKKILIAIIVIFIVLAIGAVSVLGVFNQTTEIDNKFFSGTLKGVIIENDSDEYPSDWIISYRDTENSVYYDIIMANSFNFTKEGMTHSIGTEKIITKEYNGVEWEIYYYSTKGEFNLEYDAGSFMLTSLPGYLCFASGKNGDYFITVSSGYINSNNSADSDLFINYVEPLLNNITLKDPKNIPKEYEILNLTKDDYDMVRTYVEQNGWELIKNNGMY